MCENAKPSNAQAEHNELKLGFEEDFQVFFMNIQVVRAYAYACADWKSGLTWSTYDWHIDSFETTGTSVPESVLQLESASFPLVSSRSNQPVCRS